MTNHIFDTQFPFKEIRDGGDESEGNYFNHASELTALGYADSQIWSVVEADSDDPKINYVIITGPSHHYVNRIGYFATNEHHDGNTYYYDYIDLME